MCMYIGHHRFRRATHSISALSELSLFGYSSSSPCSALSRVFFFAADEVGAPLRVADR